jgi:HPt (histidine-containing phosphotransfer) domain-containing protein
MPDQRDSRPVQSEELGSALQPEPQAELVEWQLLDQLRQMGSIGREAIGIALGLFRDEGGRLLSQLEDALASTDRTQIGEIAHTLRGGSRQIGASALANHCAAIEVAAGTVAEAELAAQIGQVRQLYAATLGQLERRYTDG